MSSQLVIIPTYNESANIAALLSEIFQLSVPLDVLIVDDNSPDGTGKIIDEMIQKKFSRHLFVLHRQKKGGLGAAYIDGFRWALKHNYKYICSMDADFSHNPRYIPQILLLLKQHDLVIGSRYIKLGGIENWSLCRRILSRFGNIYAKLFLLSKINDLTGGYNGYKRDWLRKINIANIKSKGYSFQVEIKFRHTLLGANVYEMPIIFTERTLGHSKINQHIIKEALLRIPYLAYNRRKIKKQMEINKHE